jgi:hypothetical protein
VGAHELSLQGLLIELAWCLLHDCGSSGELYGLGLDHSLGRDAGESPEPLRTTRD